MAAAGNTVSTLPRYSTKPWKRRTSSTSAVHAGFSDSLTEGRRDRSVPYPERSRCSGSRTNVNTRRSLIGLLEFDGVKTCRLSMEEPAFGMAKNAVSFTNGKAPTRKSRRLDGAVAASDRAEQ